MAQPPAPAPRTYSIGFLLADVLRLSRQEFFRRAGDLRLTPALTRLLYYVKQRPGSTQAELAGYLDLSSVSIGRMIDRLEARGFVRRTADAHDRRAFRIHPDAAAAPLVAQMDDLVAAVSAKARKGVPAEDYAAFQRTLEQMRRNLSQD